MGVKHSEWLLSGKVRTRLCLKRAGKVLIMIKKKEKKRISIQERHKTSPLVNPSALGQRNNSASSERTVGKDRNGYDGLLLWRILERKLNISALDESSASVLVRLRRSRIQPVKPGLFRDDVLTVDTAHYGNIFFISHSLGAQIKTMKIIPHSDSKYRLIVYRENTQSYDG